MQQDGGGQEISGMETSKEQLPEAWVSSEGIGRRKPLLAWSSKMTKS